MLPSTVSEKWLRRAGGLLPAGGDRGAQVRRRGIHKQAASRVGTKDI